MELSILNTLLDGLSNETNAITVKCKFDTETRAKAIVERFRENQAYGCYNLADSRITYKCKKDKKTNDIIDEFWNTTLQITEAD